MPLLDRQRRGVVLGSIRIGTKVQGRDGKIRPVKLTTFRLTSPDRAKVEAAAAAYGGEVTSWQAREGGPQQWQVTTERDVLPVRVPPGNPVEQNYEAWGATRKRLCDGFTERMSGEPCKCPADLMQRKALAARGDACKPITRLCLVLADLPGLGVWQLSSTGDSAADELASVAEALQRAELGNVMLPACLRLEQRTSGASGEIHHYAVPVLDVGVSLAALEAGMLPALGPAGPAPLALEGIPAPAPDGPAWTSAQSLYEEALISDDARAVWRMGQFADKEGWLDETCWHPESNVGELLGPALHERVTLLTDPTAP